jgi:hypothetical protein
VRTCSSAEGAKQMKNKDKIVSNLHEIELALLKMRNALTVALKSLDELSKLGNGNKIGNSDGNVIAIRAIEEIKEALDICHYPTS